MLCEPTHASCAAAHSLSLFTNCLLVVSPKVLSGYSVFTVVQDSEDIRYMVGALKALGVQLEERWEQQEAVVVGCGGRFPVQGAELFLGNAGTAMRCVASAASAPLSLGVAGLPMEMQATCPAAVVVLRRGAPCTVCMRMLCLLVHLPVSRTGC